VKLSDTRLGCLFLVSICVLCFEMAVMRSFAVASWSNFGSMVISIALLGFGLAGTLLTLAGRRVRGNPDAWLASSALALGPSMAIAHVLAQRIPFNAVMIATDRAQLLWLGAYYVVYAPPFFMGGLFIGAAFMAISNRTHALYFWNMLGSGLGGLLSLGFMSLLPPELLIYPVVALASVPALLCSVDWSPRHARFRVRAWETLLCLLLAAASLFLIARYGALAVSDFKPVSYARKFPDSRQVHRSFGARGEIEVYASSFFHFAPGLSDNASLSRSRPPRDAFLGLYVDGDGPVGVMRKLTSAEEEYIDYLPMSAPYLLVSSPRVLVLRLGGTAGIHTALHHGAKAVRVVESNPDLVRMLRDDPFFQKYTGGVLEDPRVSLTAGEVRAFAASAQERFNIVEIGLIDSYGLSQAGGYSVEENYVYTVEAIRDYMRCLAPSGFLSITVWDRLTPPRNVPRLLSTVVEALRQAGVPHPERRLFVFDLLLSTATVIVKNGELTQGETDLLRGFCRRMSFDAVYYPGIPQRPGNFQDMLDEYANTYSDPPAEPAEGSARPDGDLRPGDLYHFSLLRMLSGRQEELYRRYVFDMSPATDDKPYYSGYIKPASLPSLLKHLGDISEEWGYLLLLATLGQAIVFGALIIVLPGLFRRRELFGGRPGTLRILLYFACLGLGYMMAEIVLIQRFVYFLSDPTYANSLVITALLVSSGLGSLISSRIRAPRRLVVLCASAGIAGLSLFALVGLPPLLRAMLDLSLGFRAAAAVALIMPLGVCLGVPFPAGLESLSRSRAGILPWAWGVNGALSVAGSVLTRVVSTSAGMSVVYVCIAALYGAAGFAFSGVEGAGEAPEAAVRQSVSGR
jgi:hypothetical protein